MGLAPAVAELVAQAYDANASYANPAVWLSAHTDNPGSTGANEIAGGSPAYARQQLTFTGSGGVDSVSASTTLNMPAGVSARWAGFWTAASGGAFTAGFPLTGPPLVAVTGAGSNITIPGHGRLIGDPVRGYPLPGSIGSTMPPGMYADLTYWVVATPDGNTLQVSATKGGAPIVFSVPCGFMLCADLSQTYTAQGTLVFPAGSGITLSVIPAVA